MTARVLNLQVIVSDDIVRGQGTVKDRTRRITTIYALDGKELGSYDPNEDPDSDEEIVLPLHIFTETK